MIRELKRFSCYAFRWQLSSLILAPVIYIIKDDPILAAIVANFIGAIVFFPIDKYIFKNKKGSQSGTNI